MPNVNLSLDLASLFVDGDRLDDDPKSLRDAMRSAVVEAAASKLVQGFDQEDLHEMRQEVTRLRKEAVRAAIADQVTAAMDQPIQRTTQWGDTIGDVTNVRELIRLELEAFLNGTKTNRRHDSYDKTPNNLAELIGEVANETMRGQMADTVMAARKAVAARIQEILTTKVAAELAKPR